MIIKYRRESLSTNYFVKCEETKTMKQYLNEERKCWVKNVLIKKLIMLSVKGNYDSYLKRKQSLMESKLQIKVTYEARLERHQL